MMNLYKYSNKYEIEMVWVLSADKLNVQNGPKWLIGNGVLGKHSFENRREKTVTIFGRLQNFLDEKSHLLSTSLKMGE